MAKSKLLKVSYRDSANGIHLTNYADICVFREENPNTKVLASIRFGGYPESVRAMSDAIYGGGDIEIESANDTWKLSALTKQYRRQLNANGVYAESTMIVNDDDSVSKLKNAAGEDETDGQEELELPPRTYYIFCPQGDSDRLFEEIDRKVSVPLIPEYKDFVLKSLKDKGILYPLTVWTCSEQFDAWALCCSKDDRNIVDVLEDGLHSGAISIPGAENADCSIFERITGVTAYLREFGVSMANKIKARFNPLFDPAIEKLSGEVMDVNANVAEQAGYSLYNAQLACVEALKRKILQHEPAIIVAECGSGKTKIGASALYAAHTEEGKQKSFNIVMCPSHVTDKWAREVEETIPNSIAAVIKSISEFRLFYAAYERDDRTAFVVISKEKARDGYMKAPSVFWNKRQRAFLCPRCYEPVEMDLVKDKVKYRVIADAEFFMNENSQNHKCECCGEVLWSPLDATRQNEWVRIGEYGFVHRKFAGSHLQKQRVEKNLILYEKILEVAENPDSFFTARSAYRAYPLSTYINHFMKGKIDGFLADELHQYAQNSGQGDAMAEIAAVADKVVGMTATLINGYSSGIFHLLWRLFSRFMVLDLQKFEDPKRFDTEYGVTESVYEVSKSKDGNYNSNRRTSKVKVRERLLPGVSPLVYSRFLLEHAVFLSLMDMGKELPEYEEFPIPLDMPQAIDVRAGVDCPTCCRSVTEDSLDATRAGIERGMEALVKNGIEKNSQLLELRELDKKAQEVFDNWKTEDLEKQEARIAELTQQRDKILSQPDDGAAVIAELLARRQELEEAISLGGLTADEKMELDCLEEELQGAIRDYNSVKALCDRPEPDIAGKRKELGDLILQTKNMITAALDYLSARNELTFKGLPLDKVGFSLYDIYKTTGEVKNTFRFTYDGRDYRKLSHSERVFAGMEVSELIKALTGRNYPVFVDDSESVVTLPKSPSGQVLLSRVMANVPLTVTVRDRQPVTELKKAS